MNKLAAFIAIIQLFACGSKTERVKPKLAGITESVYASASIKAANQYSVYPKVNGILKDILVKPGEIVKAGQTLFVLENKVGLLNLENSRLSVRIAREADKKIDEQKLLINQSRRRFLIDSALYHRQQRLWKLQIGTRLDFEQKELAYLDSRSAYQLDLLKLKDLYTQLDNDLQRSRINYDINTELSADYQIKSAINGLVFDILFDRGEYVTPQSPLAVIGADQSFVIEMEVDENDIASVRRGQIVVLTMDSYRGKTFNARIDQIYPIMNPTTRAFKVCARFLNPPLNLYPNLTAEANILIKTKARAITVPRNYVINNKWVLLDGNKKRNVKTGLSDFQKIEITSGLDTGEYIYKPANEY